MKRKEEIEQLAQEIHYDSAQQGLDANGCFNQYQGFIKGYTQCQEDMADNNLSNEVLFKQAIVAMEEHYGYGCETEIDAYFRGLKWMQKQYNKQD
jgi:hypothetical protein